MHWVLIKSAIFKIGTLYDMVLLSHNLLFGPISQNLQYALKLPIIQLLILQSEVHWN